MKKDIVKQQNKLFEHQEFIALIETPRIIFAGTPEFAAVYLQALMDAGYPPVAVYTQPDRKSGRGKKLSPSEVKQVALVNQLDVFQPQNFKLEDDIQQLKDLQPDLLIVVAYGLLLPEKLLSIPKLGCINAHASLLPRWRGAAPIQRAIQAGDKETGVCLMQMEPGLDTGAVLAEVRTSINNMTAAQLHHHLAKDGAELLVKTLPQILASEINPIAQDNEFTTYARKLTKHEAAIDWTLSANELERQIRAFNSWPVSYFQFKEKTLRVWEAEVDGLEQTAELPGTLIQISSQGLKVATGKGVLTITSLQMPGKKAMSVQQILVGHSELFKIGVKFS